MLFEKVSFRATTPAAHDIFAGKKSGALKFLKNFACVPKSFSEPQPESLAGALFKYATTVDPKDSGMIIIFFFVPTLTHFSSCTAYKVDPSIAFPKIAPSKRLVGMVGLDTFHCQSMSERERKLLQSSKAVVRDTERQATHINVTHSDLGDNKLAISKQLNGDVSFLAR